MKQEETLCFKNNTGEEGKPMRRWGRGLWMLSGFVLVFLVGAAGGWWLRGMEPQGQTFYASILEIRDEMFRVEGLSVNDVNFRGEFTFRVDEDMDVVWRYTDLEAEDLAVGDHIAITFVGDILETDPARIQRVTRLQLLDDSL